MATIELKLNGLKELAEKLKAAPARVRSEVMNELYLFGEEVMGASKLIVPVDTGTLEGSGHVECPELGIAGNYQFDPVTAEEGVVAIGYGGPARNYALYVHEALEGPHPINPNWSWARKGRVDWTRPGSGPKYLERPLREKLPDLPGRLKNRVTAAFKKA